MPNQALPFVGRKTELEEARFVLARAAIGEPSRTLTILGDSGTGKTRFCAELLTRINADHPDALCLYTDLNADEFSSTNVLQILVSIAWTPREFSKHHLSAVPSEASLFNHVRSRNRRRDVSRRVVRGVAEAVRTVPGAWSSLAALVPDLGAAHDGTLQAGDLAVVLFGYLDEVARQRPVFLVLDNYQFLSHSLRVLLECRANAIPNRFCFVPVIRTVDGETSTDPALAFSSAQHRIVLRNVGRSTTREVLRQGGVMSEELEGVVLDAMLKTSGNLKELEYYFRSYVRTGTGDPSRSRITSLLDSIAKLPQLERALVAVASLFPAGVELEHVRRIVYRILFLEDPARIDEAVRGLVAIGYVVVNSASGESLKPAHERVVRAVREGVTEDEILEVREAAVAAFEELLQSQSDWRRRPYLLHCLVGLMSIHELRQRMGAVSALVDHQFREHNYAYIVALIQSLPELPRLLPDAILTMLLDALQRTSEFYLGLDIVRALRNTGRGDNEALALYEAKYLVQTYHAEEALGVLEGVRDSDAALLCRLNALQILSREEDALTLIQARRRAPTESEPWAVALRNSAHLVGHADAVQHLRQALGFFERTGSEYCAATVRNNLGVVYIWAAEHEAADRVLKESRDVLQRLASSEVYQPLINLSVLSYLRDDLQVALALLDQAGRWVPANLALDHLVVEANRAVFEFHARSKSPAETVERFRTLLRDSRRIRDPRLQNEIAYNLHELETHFADSVSGAPDPRFVRLFHSSDQTGFEVRHPVEFGGADLSLLVILSPHWRH